MYGTSSIMAIFVIETQQCHWHMVWEAGLSPLTCSNMELKVRDYVCLLLFITTITPPPKKKKKKKQQQPKTNTSHLGTGPSIKTLKACDKNKYFWAVPAIGTGVLLVLASSRAALCVPIKSLYSAICKQRNSNLHLHSLYFVPANSPVVLGTHRSTRCLKIVHWYFAKAIKKIVSPSSHSELCVWKILISAPVNTVTIIQFALPEIKGSETH